MEKLSIVTNFIYSYFKKVHLTDLKTKLYKMNQYYNTGIPHNI